MSIQIVGVVILLAGLVLFVGKPPLLLHASLFLTFFENVAVVIIERPGGLYGVPAWSYFLFLSVVAAGLGQADHVGQGRTRRRAGTYLVPLQMFLLACLGSLVVAYQINGRESILPASLSLRAYPHSVTLDAANFVVAVPMTCAVILAIMLSRAVSTMPDIVPYLRTCAIGVCVVALLGFVEFLSNVLEFSNPVSTLRAVERTRAEVQLGGSTVYRLSSVSFEPSLLARVLLVGLFILLVAISYRIRLMGRFADAVAAGAIFMALVLTGATTAFVGVAAGIAAAAVYALRRGSVRAWGVLTLATSILLTVGYAVYQSVPVVRVILSVLLFEKQESDSYVERTTATTNAYQTIERHPFFGVGLGESGSYDLIGKIGSNVGLVGLATFGLLVGGTLIRMWRRTGSSEEDATTQRVPAVLGSVLLMLLMVYQFTGFYFETAYFWALLGLAWGACAVLDANEGASATPAQPALGQPSSLPRAQIVDAACDFSREIPGITLQEGSGDSGVLA